MDQAQNPWREGDFLIYGEAVPLGDGFAAFYWVDHHLVGEDAPCRQAVRRRRFGHEIYKSDDLARVQAVSAGQHWVRLLSG